MKRVKMVLAYDGTNYCGWQLQSNGITIEAVLGSALSELLRDPIVVIGASRTDSGVHAEGNVAVFDTENRMPADKICFALKISGYYPQKRCLPAGIPESRTVSKLMNIGF